MQTPNFEIPSIEDRTSIEVGVFAKMIFVESTHNERMWVEVTAVDGDEYTGRLANIPVFTDLEQHSEITFSANHVIEIRKPWPPPLPL